jgi:hypothetical protein
MPITYLAGTNIRPGRGSSVLSCKKRLTPSTIDDLDNKRGMTLT